MDERDDISRLFWAAMRDKELREKLIDLGCIQVKFDEGADPDGDDFSASWVGHGPDLTEG